MLLLILNSEVNSEMFKDVQNLGKRNGYISGVSAVPALCAIQRNIIKSCIFRANVSPY